MDVRIEATAMVANAVLVTAEVHAFSAGWLTMAIALISEQVASFSCPSLGGVSLSAVSPDLNFMKGTSAAA